MIFFTNSNHVPVYYNIQLKKNEVEAPYHELTNAGHISYVEIGGQANNNLEAVDDIVRLMFKNYIGYGSINHHVDRCNNCGIQEIIKNNCPQCDSNDITRIRRITGYIVGDQKIINLNTKGNKT